MSALYRRLGALGIMVIGVGVVMTLMTLMNRYTQPPAKTAKRAATVVEIKKVKPKPKKRKARPKRQAKKARRARPRTPPPNLGSSMSGVALGGPIGLGQTAIAGGDELLGSGDSKNLLMTSDTVDEPPKATRRVAPKYPSTARKKGVTGFVSFSLVIGPAGEIVRSRIVRAEPAGVFEEAAKNAIERWTFQPGTYKGKPQTVVVEQTIRFTLTRGA